MIGDLYRFEIDLASRKIEETCKDEGITVDDFQRDFTVKILLRCLKELEAEWLDNYIADQDC